MAHTAVHRNTAPGHLVFLLFSCPSPWPRARVLLQFSSLAGPPVWVTPLLLLLGQGLGRGTWPVSPCPSQGREWGPSPARAAEPILLPQAALWLWPGPVPCWLRSLLGSPARACCASAAWTCSQGMAGPWEGIPGHKQLLGLSLENACKLQTLLNKVLYVLENAS